MKRRNKKQAQPVILIKNTGLSVEGVVALLCLVGVIVYYAYKYRATILSVMNNGTKNYNQLAFQTEANVKTLTLRIQKLTRDEEHNTRLINDLENDLQSLEEKNGKKETEGDGFVEDEEVDPNDGFYYFQSPHLSKKKEIEDKIKNLMGINNTLAEEKQHIEEGLEKERAILQLVLRNVKLSSEVTTHAQSRADVESKIEEIRTSEKKIRISLEDIQRREEAFKSETSIHKADIAEAVLRKIQRNAGHSTLGAFAGKYLAPH